MSFVPFLQASTSTSGSFASTMIMMVLLIGIFYFFLIRPQNKKQKETERMLSALKKGDKVVTIGGVHGVISSVKEKSIVLKVDDNVKIEFSRSAIAGLENAVTPAVGKKDKGDKKAGKGEKSDRDEGVEHTDDAAATNTADASEETK